MSLLDDVAELMDGKMYAEYFAAICIFHADSKPSLLVNEEYYHCLSCGVGGSTKSLLAKLKGHPVEKKRHYSGLPWYRWIKEDNIKEFANTAHKNLKTFPSQASYLKKRKITPSIDPLKVGWIDGVYIFPIWNRKDKIVGLVARTGEVNQEESDIRYCTPPHQDGMLFVPDWKIIDDSDTIYVTYGIIDAIVLLLCGLASVTWSIGKNLPAEALDGFRKKIVIIPDFGEEKQACKLVAELGWRGRVCKLDYPDGCKDPADIYQNFNKKTLINLLTRNKI